MLTVTAPAASRRLTTIEAVRAELGSSSADDAHLAELIDQASAAIERWCGRAFALEGVRQVFRLARPAETLTLDRWPVESVSGVTLAGTPLSAVEIELDADTGCLGLLTGTDTRPWPAGRIVVDYTAGYAAIPADLARAACLMVKAAVFAQGRDASVKTSTYADATVTFGLNGLIANEGLPPDVLALVAPYRNFFIG